MVGELIEFGFLAVLILCWGMVCILLALYLENLYVRYALSIKCFLFSSFIKKRCVHKRCDVEWNIVIYSEEGLVLSNVELFDGVFDEVSRMFILFFEIFFPEISLQSGGAKTVSIYFFKERTHEFLDSCLRDGVRTDGFYVHPIRSIYVRGRDAQCDMVRDGPKILKHELFHFLCQHYSVKKHLSSEQEEGAARLFEMCASPSPDIIFIPIFEET